MGLEERKAGSQPLGAMLTTQGDVMKQGCMTTWYWLTTRSEVSPCQGLIVEAALSAAALLSWGSALILHPPRRGEHDAQRPGTDLNIRTLVAVPAGLTLQA